MEFLRLSQYFYFNKRINLSFYFYTCLNILIKFNNQLVKQYDKWDFQFEFWTLPKIVDVAREQNKFLKAQKKSLINTIQIIQSVEWYHDGEVTEVPMIALS